MGMVMLMSCRFQVPWLLFPPQAVRAASHNLGTGSEEQPDLPVPQEEETSRSSLGIK